MKKIYFLLLSALLAVSVSAQNYPTLVQVVPDSTNCYVEIIPIIDTTGDTIRDIHDYAAFPDSGWTFSHWCIISPVEIDSGVIVLDTTYSYSDTLGYDLTLEEFWGDWPAIPDYLDSSYGTGIFITAYFTPTEDTTEVGINQISTETKVIYPNPTTGLVIVPQNITNVDVYNVLGQRLFSTAVTNSTINLESLVQGTYFLVTHSTVRQVATYKILKH